MWLACAYLIGLPNTTRVISEWSSQAAILPSENIRAAISFYGLATLVPLAVIVCVFLLAHVVGQFARLVGNILPGYLIQNTTLALYQALKPWYLRRLWVCYPELTGANGLNTLDLLIDEAMERAAVDPNGHYLLKARYFTKTRLNRFRDRAAFAKGVLVIVFGLWVLWPLMFGQVFGNQRPTGRFGMIALMALGWITLNALWRIGAESEFARMKVSTFLAVEGSKRPNGGEPESATGVRDVQRCEDLEKTLGSKQVWSFTLFPVAAPKILTVRALFSAIRNFQIFVGLRFPPWGRSTGSGELKPLGDKDLPPADS